MADFSALKTAIQNAIRTNGNNEITGQLLQDILLSMVVELGDEAITNVADDLSTETTQRQNADSTLQGNINAEATARATADAALQNAINTINSNISNGYVYAGIATPSATPVTGKVFYIATTAGTYTNFGGLIVTKGINILKYNGSSWSQEQIIGINDYPTAGSSGLALSGGIDAEIKSLVGYYTCGTAAATAAKTITASAYILLQGGSVKVKFTYKNTAADATLKIGSADAKPLFYGGRRAGSSNSWEAGEVVEIFYDGTNYMANNVMGGGAGDGAFDISVYNAVDGTPTPYTDLAAALGTNGANIPEPLRKGGMSVKFIQGTVQSSDNKYVQYRFMLSEFTAAQFTNTANWQGVDDEPTAGSENLVKSGGVFESTVLYKNSTNELIQKDFSLLIRVGSIYNGTYDVTAKDCLMINKYFEADDLKYLHIHLAEDIMIRVSFYNNNKTHISNTGNYANLKFVEIPAGAKYFRLSANYSAKGYGNSNPVAVTDYTIGDFYVANWQFKVDETPTRDSNNHIVTSDGLSKVINGEIDCTKLIETGYDDNNSWLTTNANYKGVCIKCSANDAFIITAGANAPFYSFLTSIPLVDGTVPRVSGTTRKRMTANTTIVIVVPEGTSYLYLSKIYNPVNTLPEKLVFIGKYYGIVDNINIGNSLLPSIAKQKIVLNTLSDLSDGITQKWNLASRTYFVNGGNYQGNIDISNKSAISVYRDVYFETGKLSRIKIYNTGNRTDGCFWKIRVIFFKENKQYLSQTAYIKDIDVEVPTNAFYYKLTFELRTSNDTSYYSSTGITVTPYLLGDTDLAINNDCMDDEDKVIKRNNDVAVACVYYDEDSALSVGHISDLHGDMADKQFADFVRVCNKYCDLGIITGDIVYNNFTHSFNYYNNYIGQSKNKVLLAIGNHDVGSSDVIAECGTHQEVYDKFFDPYIADWGVTYESGNNYYYKDYSDRKIRVIVMYDYDSPLDIDPEDATKYKYFRGNLAYSTEQLTWLIGVLQDAATKDYSVVIAKHMMEGLVSGQSVFMTANNPTAIHMNHILNGATPVGDIVNAFQNSIAINETYSTDYGQISAVGDFTGLPNGKFAAYICGHYHRDIVGTLVKYPSQNVIAVDCDNSHNQSGTDIFKTPGERSMDSINIYKISDANRRITISRIGGNYSKTAQHRDMIMLTY